MSVDVNVIRAWAKELEDRAEVVHEASTWVDDDEWRGGMLLTQASHLANAAEDLNSAAERIQKAITAAQALVHDDREVVRDDV